MALNSHQRFRFVLRSQALPGKDVLFDCHAQDEEKARQMVDKLKPACAIMECFDFDAMSTTFVRSALSSLEDSEDLFWNEQLGWGSFFRATRYASVDDANRRAPAPDQSIHMLIPWTAVNERKGAPFCDALIIVAPQVQSDSLGASVSMLLGSVIANLAHLAVLRVRLDRIGSAWLSQVFYALLYVLYAVLMGVVLYDASWADIGLDVGTFVFNMCFLRMLLYRDLPQATSAGFGVGILAVTVESLLTLLDFERVFVVVITSTYALGLLYHIDKAVKAMMRGWAAKP